jgi:hypothetical protein
VESTARRRPGGEPMSILSLNAYLNLLGWAYDSATTEALSRTRRLLVGPFEKDADPEIGLGFARASVSEARKP